MTDPQPEIQLQRRPLANAFTPSVNNVIKPSARATDRHDALTVSAVAVIVYALASLLHEAVGHGGACLLVHGAPAELSSMHFMCNLPDSLSREARIVSAGGTLATVIGGLLSLGLYRWQKGPPVLRYALWLFAAVNLMQGTGYFLFSGIGDVGDWADVIKGVEYSRAWRLFFAAAGFTAYYLTTIRLFPMLGPLIGEARPRRYHHALRLAGRVYLVGGVFEIITGLFNPGGFELVLVSGAAASLGGTSGLAWGSQLLRGTRTPSAKLEEHVDCVHRSWITIALAVIIGVAFIVVLGPGIQLR